MKFTTNPPQRKKKVVRNLLIEDPSFVRLVAAMRAGLETAGLVFEPSDAKRFRLGSPARVAADRIRRLIRAELLPYRVRKYLVDGSQWGLRVDRQVVSEEGSTPSRVSAAS